MGPVGEAVDVAVVAVVAVAAAVVDVEQQQPVWAEAQLLRAPLVLSEAAWTWPYPQWQSGQAY